MINSATGVIGTLGGFKVVSSPMIPNAEPRMELRSHVQVTDKFRAEFDLWLLEFFGEVSKVYFIDGTLFMSEGALAALKLESKKDSAREGMN